MATFTGADKAINFLFDMVSNIAADYDETETYSVDSYAIYSGILYKCTAAISSPETFTPAHWDAVLIMDEITTGGGGSSTLAGLNDVSISSPTDGQALIYDSATSKWKNAAGGGGSSTLAGLNDVSISSPTDGQALIYDSATSKWKNAAGGGGNWHTWSRTEHAVGVWVDGKTVYEKTIQYTCPNSSAPYHIPHNISNMQTVVSLTGIINHSEVIPYGETFPSKDSSMGRASINATEIYVGITGSWSGYILEITVQYTKSS